ncbi:flagellar type III secretion system pore protein FliP [Alkaliphilus sp. MSJ-5]|uniref:Flagellar biosynthetic protein FliP n=1 Tax=Alkaliphilus flagellatus TaxID=2841507 RepID=A0ABS6G4X7_9FIRM|nr:flagellar type III secretion system pore protein FliP [Alkaliphilus flagellatus]MBU5677429.1 flagellar type III secretion system pore protein FliP [Alkaliphilus flagellatus]
MKNLNCKFKQIINMKNKNIILLCLIIVSFFLLGSTRAFAQTNISIPNVQLNIDGASSPEETASSLQLLGLLTVLSLAPAILIMVTSFTRIIIVLSFLRNAIATQQTPPTQVLIGLALFLTFFIMSPIASEINQNALQPYLNEEITQSEAIEEAMEPLRQFMFRQTRENDIALFLEASGTELSSDPQLDDIPTTSLIPAFIISELKTAFQMGFVLFIPFIVLDMVVSSALMSMGMMMLPPAMISLPFKLLLFVMVDGWNVLIKSLLLSFK